MNNKQVNKDNFFQSRGVPKDLPVWMDGCKMGIELAIDTIKSHVMYLEDRQLALVKHKLLSEADSLSHQIDALVTASELLNKQLKTIKKSDV